MERREAPRNAAALNARPKSAPVSLPIPGQHLLGLESARDTLLYVPTGLEVGVPAPLILLLHGAGGEAAGGLGLLSAFADSHRIIMAAPSSRGSTWDGIRGAFGPDVDVINRALERIFQLVSVDLNRVAIGGFSDGASYALGLGLANGNLFSDVVAFSPGFIPLAPKAGKPRVFVSHGDGDSVLPIDRTSRRLVPSLVRDGYEVTYREFAGPHTVPGPVVQEAVAWLGWQPW
ncbi:phospholipase [Pseudarthrobacter sp. NamB4]|nr:phospholipase [Pseudarthrobacter sp. NamB4]